MALIAMATGSAVAQPPTVSSATFKLRLDAAQGVTTSSGLVTQWNDLSGAGNNFNQLTASDRPALIPSGLNSLPTVRFTGDDLNVIGAGLNANPAQPFTIFTATAGGTNPLGLFDSAPGLPDVFRHFPNNNVELWSGSPNAPLTLHSAGSVVSTSGYINNSLRNLNNREFFGPSGLVGNAAVSTNVNNVVFSAPNIGSINNLGNGAFGGDLSEMLIYQGQMSVPDRFAVEVYLRNKYNVNPAAPGSLQQLPNPVISGSATAHTSNPAFRAETAQDGNLGTDYASNGLGAATFMDFNFGAPTLITRVDYYDRATGSPVGADNVTAYDLIFSNDAIFGNAGDTTVSVSSPGIALDQVVINGGAGIMAQFVRWDVVTTTGTNPGAAEFVFFTNLAAVPEPNGVALWSILGAVLMIVGVVRLRSQS